MTRLIIYQTAAVLIGFIIDFFAGDPYALPHPVAAIGRLISFLDKKFRRGNSNINDVGRGILTVIIVAAVSTAVPAALLFCMWKIHPIVYLAVNSIMCWQLVAARQLEIESSKVQRTLEKGDVEGARNAVSYIVGRDTDVLDESGICRAAVETVAENASDGVTAPLFWIFLFGAAGGFFYKAVNTMDSMLGYKNEKYLYFGRAAAKTDDAVNFIPARICALLMVAVCPACGLDGRTAYRIFRRDRYKHASPNSAQTESVCAGALNVRLAGDAVYGGVVRKKEYLGDDIRPIEPEDIKRSNRLMYAASWLILGIGILARIAVILAFTAV
ncbi:MAG: adenosylcobinamide-phosphate synthase CbiB [Lachnospiraceae bacterium]|nr:adenosylcobinamide-phosphate synthase CbiB [Lachnospiraceae bacterium]